VNECKICQFKIRMHNNCKKKKQKKKEEKESVYIKTIEVGISYESCWSNPVTGEDAQYPG